MLRKYVRFIVVITAMLAVILASYIKECSLYATTQELPVKQTFKVNGHTAFVIMPRQTDLKKPIPWVWYAPTLPGLPESRENWMFDRFLAKGIAIAGIDVGESYGSPDGRKVYTALYQELVTHRGFAPKAALLARSRGGLMLYSWACENPNRVACIAGIYPVCDLRSYPGLDKASKAYGLTRAALEKQLDLHNPVLRLTPLAKAGVPIFHIHGDVDKVVQLQENSGDVARQYQRLGGKMEVKIAHGQGNNLWEGFFQCQQLVDFVIANTSGNSNPPKVVIVTLDVVMHEAETAAQLLLSRGKWRVDSCFDMDSINSWHSVAKATVCWLLQFLNFWQYPESMRHYHGGYSLEYHHADARITAPVARTS